MPISELQISRIRNLQAPSFSPASRINIISGQNDNPGSPWAKVLQHNTPITASGPSASIDNGAATTNGWSANLHILENDVDTDYEFSIEVSSN